MGKKILIIGCGSIGRRHAANLYKMGGVELLLSDIDQARAKGLATEVKGKRVENIEEAFKEMPDAALICTPTALHLELAFQALKNDCQVFVEKPISHSMESVDALISQAQERGKIVMVGLNFRFDPLLKRLRALLREGRLGHVTSARLQSGSYLPWRHPWEDYRVGYGARRDLGGGVILDAVHELDLAIWLFGRPATVYCAGGRLSDLEIDVEDCAEITLGYSKAVVSIHLDYVQRPASRTCEIIGTCGQLKADLFARELSIFDGVSRKWELSEGTGALDEMYEREMGHFIDCVENGIAPDVDATCAAESLFLAEIAKESMRVGLPIRFAGYLNEGATIRNLSRA